jgi:hypothetical protein
MKLIQVIEDGENVAIFDISETDCPDEKLKTEIKNAYKTQDEPEEYLEEKWGITRVFIEEEIYI